MKSQLFEIFRDFAGGGGGGIIIELSNFYPPFNQAKRDIQLRLLVSAS